MAGSSYDKDGPSLTKQYTDRVPQDPNKLGGSQIVGRAMPKATGEARVTQRTTTSGSGGTPVIGGGRRTDYYTNKSSTSMIGGYGMGAYSGGMYGQRAAKSGKPVAGPYSKSGNKEGSFGEAFASARAAGKSTFSYNGKSYTTKMKGETGTTSVKTSSSKSTVNTTRPTATKPSTRTVNSGSKYSKGADTVGRSSGGGSYSSGGTRSGGTTSGGSYSGGGGSLGGASARSKRDR